jgi:hypothetical protein
MPPNTSVSFNVTFTPNTPFAGAVVAITGICPVPKLPKVFVIVAV